MCSVVTTVEGHTQVSRRVGTHERLRSKNRSSLGTGNMKPTTSPALNASQMQFGFTAGNGARRTRQWDPAEPAPLDWFKLREVHECVA